MARIRDVQCSPRAPDCRVHRVCPELVMQRLTSICMQMDDIKEFRQWGSKTPGHPENFITEGVEVTTGAAIVYLYLYRTKLAIRSPMLVVVLSTALAFPRTLDGLVFFRPFTCASGHCRTEDSFVEIVH